MCEWKSHAKKNKEMLRFTTPTRVSGSLTQKKKKNAKIYYINLAN